MRDWLRTEENSEEYINIRHNEWSLVLLLTCTPKEKLHTHSLPGLRFRPPWRGLHLGLCVFRKFAVVDAGHLPSRAWQSWQCSDAKLSRGG